MLFRSQCIPDDPDLWKLDNYERFLEKRREMLASELNGYLNSITDLSIHKVAITLEEMIFEGESEEQEFKQTLRWDVNEGRSEEHTSELQSLMRISYAVFCLKKKNNEEELLYKEQ